MRLIEREHLEVFTAAVVQRPGLVIRLSLPVIGRVRVEVPTILRISKGR